MDLLRRIRVQSISASRFGCKASGEASHYLSISKVNAVMCDHDRRCSMSRAAVSSSEKPVPVHDHLKSWIGVRLTDHRVEQSKGLTLWQDHRGIL